MFDSAILNDSMIHGAAESFRRAVAMYSSQTKAAAAFGTSQQNLSKLIRHGRMCPPNRVLKVEAATGIPKEDLRPDIYPRDAGPFPAGAAARGAGAENGTTRADPHPDSLSGLTA